jgi:hypothetical protein
MSLSGPSGGYELVVEKDVICELEFILGEICILKEC